MKVFQALLIFIGLSLDSFVVMMNKGATIRNLHPGTSILYAMIYAVTDVVAVAVGYLFSFALKNILSAQVEISIACLIIFAIGMFLITRAWKFKSTEEKLDKNFGPKNCYHLALLTSIDSLFLSVGFSFLGIPMGWGVLLAFVVTFITVLVALCIGYTRGSAYTRVIGMSGGALMIFFAIYLITLNILMK